MSVNVNNLQRMHQSVPWKCDNFECHFMHFDLIKLAFEIILSIAKITVK